MKQQSLSLFCTYFLLLSTLIVAMKPVVASCNFRSHGVGHAKIINPTVNFLGYNSQGLISRLSDNHYIVSNDGGMSWEAAPLNVMGTAVAASSTSSQNEAHFVSQSLVAHNVINIATFSINSASSGIWRDWNLVTLDWEPYQFYPHPTDSNVLLAFGANSDCRTNIGSPNCVFSLFFSNDFGHHWTRLLTQVPNRYGIYWTTGATSSQYGIAVIDYEDKTGGTLNRPLNKLRLIHMDLQSLVHSLTVPLPPVHIWKSHAIGVAVYKKVIFVASLRDLDHPDARKLNLFTSLNGGIEFIQAHLPATDNASVEKTYSILDIVNGSVIVHVEHEHQTFGNIYTSDSNADNYAMNLRFNTRSIFGPDFGHVQGIDGIYMANVELTPRVDGKDIGTVVTYDRGGQWNRLSPPATELSSCPDRSQCFLNIHAQTTDWRGTSYYSRARAIGIILGNGNVGKYLDLTPSLANTYMSVDAGKSWSRIATGSHIVQISQNGGFILLFKDVVGAYIDKILWSSNAGMTWNECTLPNVTQLTSRDFDGTASTSLSTVPFPNLNSLPSTRINVPELFTSATFQFTSNELIQDESKRDTPINHIFGVVAIPSRDSSARFLIAARTNSGGVFYTVDFAGIESRVCQGYDDPRSPTSDYEPWSPSDLDGDGCILGRKVIYPRMKRNAQCWPQHTTVPTILQSINCHCSRQDYMCDFCFAPNASNPDQCILDCPGYDPSQPPARCLGTYRPSNGYRLVSDDHCNGGLNLLLPPRNCPVIPIAPVEPHPSPEPTPTPVTVPVPINPVPAPDPVPQPHVTPTHPPPVPTPSPIPVPLPPSNAPAVSPPSNHPPGKGDDKTPFSNPSATDKRMPLWIVLVAVGVLLLLIITVLTSVYFLSGRNARLRHALLRCIPDRFLPAYMPPDREEGPRYHHLTRTNLNTGNDDIFNDDEFLQEDANVLDMDDE